MGDVKRHVQWSEEAIAASQRAESYLRVLVEGATRLFRLAQLHSPDTYTHCIECGKAWPCPTVLIARDTARAFEEVHRGSEARTEHHDD